MTTLAASVLLTHGKYSVLSRGTRYSKWTATSQVIRKKVPAPYAWANATFFTGECGKVWSILQNMCTVLLCFGLFWLYGQCLKIMKDVNDWYLITTKYNKASQIARFMGPTWGPPGDDRTQVGPMLAPWTLLSGMNYMHIFVVVHQFIAGRIITMN